MAAYGQQSSRQDTAGWHETDDLGLVPAAPTAEDSQGPPRPPYIGGVGGMTLVPRIETTRPLNAVPAFRPTRSDCRESGT